MWLKSNHSLFLKEILRVMISNLTFEIVLQNKHYALQCLVKGIRYKESLKKRTQKQTKQLSCTSHERTINNSTKTEQKVEKIWYPPIISHPNPNITTHPTFAYPHHLRNNIMVIISLAKMRQSNGCGSVRNDEIFNWHLGSTSSTWVSIAWLQQDTSNIFSSIDCICPNNQLRRNKTSWKNDQTPYKSYLIALAYIHRTQLQRLSKAKSSSHINDNGVAEGNWHHVILPFWYTG